GVDVDETLALMLAGSMPSETAITLAASLIRVDGMFNVNSTSVEAWKTMLGGLSGCDVITRSNDDSDAITAGEADQIPVAGLFSPADELADARTSGVRDEAQWVGRRVLSEEQIDQLARAIVREVRLRGPFLSLADFVNRRPGS